MNRTTATLAVLYLAAINASQVFAESIVYPSDSGALNVKLAPYNAVGDGVTDDTAALQKAIQDGAAWGDVVYIPDGTYLVSNTLYGETNASPPSWTGWMKVQGQSQAGTVIKLKNSCSGFTTTSAPKAVLQSDSLNAQSSNGGGNQAFDNQIQNLTVDTGSGNTGAQGIDFQGSNEAVVRNVTIKSSDVNHVGDSGITLTRVNNGPALIKNVTIDGFNYGIYSAQEIDEFTYEYVTLLHQQVTGIVASSSILSVRKLTSTNTVPAVNVYGNGLVNLIDSSLTGGGASNYAISTVDSESRCFVRNVTTSGYASAIKNRGTVISGSNVTEFVSDPVQMLHSGSTASLNLPIQDTPTFWDGNLANWYEVPSPNGSNDTTAIQTAMNSGKDTVMFRPGIYYIASTVTVPASVAVVLFILFLTSLVQTAFAEIELHEF